MRGTCRPSEYVSDSPALRERSREVKVGEHFERWTVIGPPVHDARHRLVAPCQCDCGAIFAVRVAKLLKGGSQQCRDCASRHWHRPTPRTETPVLGYMAGPAVVS